MNLLIKPSSSVCNINCNYCFYKDIADNRNTYSHKFMSDDTIRTIVKEALDKNINECTFMFQGGEPTLVGLSFYKKVINYQNEFNINNIKIYNAIQTNGINLDDDFSKFFKENDFLVGVSLDGSKYFNDLYRVSYNKSSTYEDVMSGIEKLKKYDVRFNILCVVSKNIAKNIDIIYNFYKEQNFKYLQFIPCIKSINEYSIDNDYYLNSNDYYNFLDILFNLWYEDFFKGNFIEIRNFIDYITVLKGYNPTSCGMGGFCSIHIVCESNGDIYPCDFYCTDDWKLGNINDNDLDSIIGCDKSRSFFERSLYIHDICKKCNYFKLCGGGCRRNMEPFNNNIPSLNYQCDAIKRFLDKNLNKLIKISKIID